MLLLINVIVGPADCNHRNCNHNSAQTTCLPMLEITRFTKTKCVNVVTVAVVTICWSYESLVKSLVGRESRKCQTQAST